MSVRALELRVPGQREREREREGGRVRETSGVWFRVMGLGLMLRGRGLEFKVWDLGLGFKDSGCWVED